jgi:histidyl-tRNA synthetase
MITPRTPPGVLELLPGQQLAFQRMLDTIRRGFERFGFLPLETPAYELSDVLLTKTGGETEKQVYFVQSTGALDKHDAKRPELALRFDLTVPLARYVAEHEHELAFPFRRYQIQRVYRGERAQKGRFREFYQCDIDVIGKDALSVAYDAELPAVIYGIFRELAIGKFTIKVNNRRLLRALLDSHGIAAEHHAAVLHEVDRLDKQTRAETEPHVASVIGAAAAGKLLDTVAGPVSALAGLDGYDDLQRVYDGTLALGVPADAVKIDLAVVRGLDYYTGTVYETFLDDHARVGAICSGGRYDNLAEHYTKSKLPGVGISIGATRLFSQLLELGVIAASDRAVAQVCVLRVDPELVGDYARIAAELRAAGLNVDVYGGEDKLGKQLKYVDRARVPLAVLYGSRERDAGMVKIKDLRAGSEHDVPRGELADRMRLLAADHPRT